VLSHKRVKNNYDDKNSKKYDFLPKMMFSTGLKLCKINIFKNGSVIRIIMLCLLLNGSLRIDAYIKQADPTVTAHIARIGMRKSIHTHRRRRVLSSDMV
jgi:hypothetical protein